MGLRGNIGFLGIQNLPSRCSRTSRYSRSSRYWKKTSRHCDLVLLHVLGLLSENTAYPAA